MCNIIMVLKGALGPHNGDVYSDDVKGCNATWETLVFRGRTKHITEQNPLANISWVLWRKTKPWSIYIHVYAYIIVHSCRFHWFTHHRENSAITFNIYFFKLHPKYYHPKEQRGESTYIWELSVSNHFKSIYVCLTVCPYG